MKLFVSYIKMHLKSLLLFLLFTILFAIVFSLYNLYLEAILYAALLCVCCGLIFGIFDFVRFCKWHKLLLELKGGIVISLAELPMPENLIEQDYQTLIEMLFQDKMQFFSIAENTKSEMTDYYTLWAHQIKTPIAAMRLLLQSEQSKQNADLSMELFKIEQYVEMVLQYLRLDSTSSDFVIKKYDLDAIVKQAVRKYSKLFILKKIRLDYTELGCSVLTDEKWLLFVIEQILSNGLKYTSKGKISIHMDSEFPKTLVIEDTGMGIASENIPRVFEKGFTGYNGRTDKKSTGIGLYLCKRVLTKLSHTIAIESEVGRGTKVKIDLDSIDLILE